MLPVIPPGELFQSVPVVAIERNPDNLWKIGNISSNHTSFGIFMDNAESGNDGTIQVHTADMDIVSRKLGAAVLQHRSSILLVYRIRTGMNYRWIEDRCILSYHETGDLKRAVSYLWIGSSLPTEWSFLMKGSEIWNTLNSKIRHDILNQLTAILGYLELSSDMITDPLLVDFTQKEQNAAERIRDRLIFTREYQKIGLSEFGWYSLSDLVQETLNEIVLDPVKLVVETGDTRLFVDKNFQLALGKILENIPLHAKGATAAHILIIQEKEGAILLIEDNGCGIPDANKSRIFDLGFGSHGGYGLFLAEKILSVFGIGIQERGIAGRQARFELIIPPHILDIRL